MKIYVMDAFAAKLFGGNQAGVALPEGDVSDETMRLIAAELKHSETAFVRSRADGSVDLRYFTPAGEVELCGHATIASFALLRRLGLLDDGRHVAHTKAGDLQISVDGEVVWMYMALADIMMPVRDRETLLRARQNETLVAELSRRQKVTGVHMFCLGDKTCTAWCSNFAPLYDIPEECATGTSNGALTYYLYRYGLVQPDRKNVFIQGEHMRRPSEIRSRLTVEKGDALIRVGGRAVLSLSGEIYAD